MADMIATVDMAKKAQYLMLNGMISAMEEAAEDGFQLSPQFYSVLQKMLNDNSIFIDLEQDEAASQVQDEVSKMREARKERRALRDIEKVGEM